MVVGARHPRGMLSEVPGIGEIVKKPSAATGLTRRVMSAVQQPRGHVTMLPSMADAMGAMMADVERGYPQPAEASSRHSKAKTPKPRVSLRDTVLTRA